MTSILPGSLVQVLITDTHTTGFNVQVLGFFEGTIDRLHLPRNLNEKTHKVGKKLKARVLYDFSSSPPKFALALNEHIVGLTPCKADVNKSLSMQEAYPVGTVIPGVKVLRIEPDRGLDVEVASGLEGFAHVCILYNSFFRDQPVVDFSHFGGTLTHHSHWWALESGLYPSCARHRVFLLGRYTTTLVEALCR